MSNAFKGSYEIDDGYVGGSRPQYFSIEASELPDESTEYELYTMYDEWAQQDAMDNLSVSPSRRDEFVAWALAQQNGSKLK